MGRFFHTPSVSPIYSPRFWPQLVLLYLRDWMEKVSIVRCNISSRHRKKSCTGKLKVLSSYGGLSADGRWRFYKTPVGFLGGTELLYDLELDPTGSQVVAPEQPAQLAQMRENYQAWFKDIHTVKTVYTPNHDGSGTLTGTSFLRTPGYGPYTFGMGVPDGYSGSIVAQPGVWKLSQSGNTVTAQFGSISSFGRYSREAQLPQHRCGRKFLTPGIYQ